MPEKIRVDRDELFSPKVDDLVAEQQAMRAALPEPGSTSLWRKIVFNSLFFLSVAGLLGGLVGWAILEPLFEEALVIWGTVEEIHPSAVRSEPGNLYVRGTRLRIDAQATQVDGRGGYADIQTVDQIEVGHPVRVTVMSIDDPTGGTVRFAERISVCEIPMGPGGQPMDRQPLPDFQEASGAMMVVGIFAFAIVGACIAGFIAAADGFMSRNLRRGFLCGAVGVGIAVAGGLVGLIPAGLLFGLTGMVVGLMMEARGVAIWTSASLSGFPLMILIVGRALAWGVFGMCIGLGQGAALRSKKLAANGLLGGLLGAILGGMFFEPIIHLFANTDLGDEAYLSRAFGFGIIGISTGFMIGLVEHLAKDAWLLMRAGPLAGKQFIIYRSPTVIGSSPKSEIYLFKDPDVEPRHALIRKVGNRHEIEDLETPAGTFVNSKRVKREPLKDGDQVIVGKTILEYSERTRERPG
jgi:hypothetical protein